MSLVQTYAGLVRIISGLVKKGCCCGPTCCDEPGGPPTADFDYDQSDDDPCTFKFTDQSTPGTCGSIISRLWDFGDGSTSTATNPTHAYAGSYPSGPWDVTLTVTDISGCVDVVVMSVACLDYSAVCTSCSDPIPPTVKVIIPAWTDAGSCLACTNIAGTYTLDYLGPLFSGGCDYSTRIGSDPITIDLGLSCLGRGVGHAYLVVDAFLDGAGSFVVRISMYDAPSGSIFYQATYAVAHTFGTVCQGTHTLTPSGTNPTDCGLSATVTLVV